MPPTVPQPLKHLPMQRVEAVAVAVVDRDAGVRVGDGGDVGDGPAGAARVSVCQDGLASYFEQPLPAPFHTVSVQPRERLSRLSVVPPTAVTYGEAAGYSTP